MCEDKWKICSTTTHFSFSLDTNWYNSKQKTCTRNTDMTGKKIDLRVEIYLNKWEIITYKCAMEELFTHFINRGRVIEKM
jgi:hypothetical protein